MRRNAWVMLYYPDKSGNDLYVHGVTFCQDAAVEYDNTCPYQFSERYLVTLPDEALVLAFKAGMLHIADCCNRAPNEQVTNGDIAMFCDMEACELEEEEILGIIHHHSMETT